MENYEGKLKSLKIQKYETYKPNFMHKKSSKTAPCQEDWPQKN